MDKLIPGKQSKILSINSNFEIYNRLLDIGLTPGKIIKCEMKSPLNDPVAYLISRAIIAIINKDAKMIYVEELGDKDGLP
ncbi:MAG: ferrous iron transport protein A [Bacilli bacterium]